MSIQRKGPKRLQDIKTHEGGVDRTFYPHKAFMKISCLEMEKAHRVKEKEGAQKRIEAIDARLKEIDIEKGILLNRIDNNDNTHVHTIPKEHTMSDKSRKGLVLRY